MNQRRGKKKGKRTHDRSPKPGSQGKKKRRGGGRGGGVKEHEGRGCSNKCNMNQD